MRAILLVLLSLTLLAVAKETPTTELFVNGVKVDAKAVVDLGTTYYPVEAVARAMGAKTGVSGGMISLNGRQIDTPPLVIEGEPYLALDVLAAALGATVENDPVRHIIHLRGAQVGQGPGIATYTADYKTPEQVEREKRNEMWKQAMMPGQAMLDEKEAELRKQMPKTVAALERNKPDIAPGVPFHPWMNPEGTGEAGVPDGSANAPPPEGARYASTGFAHRSADNGFYRLTVTDVKVAEALKGVNPPAYPRDGHKFVVVFVTQENLSKQKANPSWFAVRDAAGGLYPAEEALSSFSLGVMRSREITSGYVVAQIPATSEPVSVELICTPTVSVGFGPETAPEGR